MSYKLLGDKEVYTVDETYNKEEVNEIQESLEQHLDTAVEEYLDESHTVETRVNDYVHSEEGSEAIKEEVGDNYYDKQAADERFANLNSPHLTGHPTTPNASKLPVDTGVWKIGDEFVDVVMHPTTEPIGTVQSVTLLGSIVDYGSRYYIKVEDAWYEVTGLATDRILYDSDPVTDEAVIAVLEASDTIPVNYDVYHAEVDDNQQIANLKYVDDALQSAKDYADSEDATTLQSAKNYADSKDADTLQAAKNYTDQHVPEMTAANVDYYNTDSGLSATNVQDAIDEIASGSGGVSDYADLTNKPSINGQVLVANEDGHTYRLVNMSDLPFISRDVTTQNTSFPTNYTIKALTEYNGKLYVGTEEHGLYVSSDGNAFTQNTSIPADYIVTAFIEYNEKLYIGVRHYGFDGYIGLWVSADGETFTPVSGFPTDRIGVTSLCEFNEKLYIGTYAHGIYESSDGTIFTQNTGFPTAVTISALCVYNGTLYVGLDEQSYLYGTSDGERITQYMSTGTGIKRALYVYNGKLYCVSGTTLYVSSDGTIFTQNTGFPTNYIVHALTEYDGKLYVGTEEHGLYVSSDGNAFTQNTSFPTNYTIWFLTEYNGKLYVGTSSHGLYKYSTVYELQYDNTPTANSDALMKSGDIYNSITKLIPASESCEQNTSFPTTYPVQTLYEYNRKLYVGTVTHGLYVSSDGETFTQNTSFPTNYIVHALTEFDGKLYVGTNSCGIYESSDGETFTQSTSFPTDYTIIALTEFDGKLYVGTVTHGLYVSSDGETFTQNTSFPTDYTIIALTVYDGKLYVGTGSYHGLYVSSDGETFTQNTSFPTDYTISALTVYDGKLYVGTGSYHSLYVSSDGETFTQNTSFPTSYTVRTLTEYNRKLYVGTDNHGIYISSDGETFTQNTSFPTNYSASAFAEYSGKLYVGAVASTPTSGHGIYIFTVIQQDLSAFVTSLVDYLKTIFQEKA